MKKSIFTLVCLSTLSSAYGVKLVGDDFSYSAGTIVGANGGFGWTAGWTTPVTTNTTQTLLAPGTPFQYTSGGTLNIPASQVNGALQIASSANATTNTSAISRNFTSTSVTDIYLSFMVRFTAGTLGDAENFYLYFGTAGTTLARYDIGLQGLGTTDFGVRTSDNAGYTTTGGSVTASATTTYLVVGRLSQVPDTGNYNQFTLWANPTSPIQSQNTGVTSSAAGGDFSSFANLGFGFTSLDNGDTVQIDNLQIGTTWEDVITPVPFGVDSTLGLALLGGAAALRLRRKARQAR